MCSLHTVRAAGYLSLKYADTRPAAVYTRKSRPRPRISQNGREPVMKNPGIPVRRPCIHGNPVHGRKNHGKDGNQV